MKFLPLLSSVVLCLPSVNAFAPASFGSIKTSRPAFALPTDMNYSDRTDEDNQSLKDDSPVYGRRGFLKLAVATAGFSSLLNNPTSAQADDDATVTLHILDYPKAGACGEIDTTEKKAYFAKTFGGLKDGSCSTDGYTVSEGTANGVNDKDKEKVYKIYGKE